MSTFLTTKLGEVNVTAEETLAKYIVKIFILKWNIVAFNFLLDKRFSLTYGDIFTLILFY